MRNAALVLFCAVSTLAPSAYAQSSIASEPLFVEPTPPLRRVYFSAGTLGQLSSSSRLFAQLIGPEFRLGVQFNDRIALFGAAGFATDFAASSGLLRLMTQSEFSFGPHFALAAGVQFEHAARLGGGETMLQLGMPLSFAFYAGAVPIADREFVRHQFRVGFDLAPSVAWYFCEACEPPNFVFTSLMTLAYTMR